MSSEDPFYNRRVKGTEAQKFRHRAALAILAISGLFAAVFHYGAKPQSVIQMIQERSDKNRVNAEAHRLLILESLSSSSSTIKKKKQEEEDGPV